jgi:DNA-binding transcriptional MocR family regulator
MSFSKATVQLPKYQQVVEVMKNEILAGRYQPGQKLPSEAAMVKRFGASRITVGRALRELRQAGLIQSRPGSGSYVGPAAAGENGLLFGLLIPNLGDTEIFGPICQGMSQAPQARKNALLWGNSANSTSQKKSTESSLLPWNGQPPMTKPIIASLRLSNEQTSRWCFWIAAFCRIRDAAGTIWLASIIGGPVT